MNAPPPILSAAAERQIVSGRAFVLDAPDHVPALWGADRDVLWSAGEAAFIVGPQGVGKTTIMQQVALRRAGVLDGDLIGYPVTFDSERATLYLALDRPRQIARSFARMVNNTHADALAGLVVWEGPLPFDLVRHPERLREVVNAIGATVSAPIGTVCIDSTKDIASGLSSDETGGAINRAIGGLIAHGIEVIAAHHQRKATAEKKRPRTLDDVYGSTWITAGAGSVVLIWGEPGDPLVELTHLKQPADEVGPLTLAHDHDTGTTTRRDTPDAWTLLQAATRGGLTAPDAAEAIYGTKPSRSQVEKVRRRLEKFVENGHAVRIEPPQKNDAKLYRPVADVTLRDRPRDTPTQEVTHQSRGSRTPVNTGPAPLTPPTVTAPHPPLRSRGGERDPRVTPDTDLPPGWTQDALDTLTAEHRAEAVATP